MTGFLAAAIAVGATLAAAQTGGPVASGDASAPPAGLRAIVETARGTMRVDLYPDEAPLGVASVCFLAREGFYDGLSFHAVSPEFVVTGDPTGTGAGSAGYRIRHEFNLKRKHTQAGVVALGNQGVDTGGSQIVIDRKPMARFDGRMTVIGQVVEGLEVVDRLVPGDLVESMRVEGDVDALLARFPEEVAAWQAARTLRSTGEPELRTMAMREVVDRGLNADLGYFTETGLWALDLVAGQGPPASGARQVRLRIGGWLPDGAMFQSPDKPLDRTDPRFFVSGIREALEPMRVGGRKIVVVPAALAYGDRGHPAADIPPNMPLIFEIELVEVVR